MQLKLNKKRIWQLGILFLMAFFIGLFVLSPHIFAADNLVQQTIHSIGNAVKSTGSAAKKVADAVTGTDPKKNDSPIFDAYQKGDLDYVINHINSFKLYHESAGLTNLDAKGTYLLADTFWSFAMMIYTSMDSLITVLFNTSSVNDLINWAAGITKSLYSGLSGVIMGTFLSIGALVAVMYYFTKGRTAGVKQLIQMFVLIAASSFWFSNVGPIVSDLNSVSDSLSATLATNISDALKQDNSNKNFTELTSKTPATASSSVAIVRKNYFDNSTYKLWRIGTFGESDVNDPAIKLFLKPSPLSEKDVDKLKGDTQVKNYKSFLLNENAQQKSSVAFGGIFVVLLDGIPYVLIGFLNWIATMIALTLVFGTPVLAMLSFVPRFGNSFYRGMEQVVKAFLFKAGSVLLIVVVNLSGQIVDLLTSGGGNPKGTAALAQVLVSTILQFVLLYLVFRFRNQFLSVLSGGTISNVPYAGNVSSALQAGRDSLSGHRKTQSAEPRNPDEQSTDEKLDQLLDKLNEMYPGKNTGNPDGVHDSFDDEQNNIKDDIDTKLADELEDDDDDVYDEKDEKDEEGTEDSEGPDSELPEDDPDVDIPSDLDGDDFDDSKPDIPSGFDDVDPDVDIPKDLDQIDDHNPTSQRPGASKVNITKLPDHVDDFENQDQRRITPSEEVLLPKDAEVPTNITPVEPVNSDDQLYQDFDADAAKQEHESLDNN